MDTGKTRHGRLRAAWGVLLGQQVTPVQMRAEWLEYQLAFDGIFDKLNTSLARIAKREQRVAAQRLDALAAETGTVQSQGPETNAEIKARLRRQVQAQRFGGMG